MFTQVYFNVTGKVLELHLNEWLASEGRRWPADAERFLEHDDLGVWSRHARAPPSLTRAPSSSAITTPLAFETREHLTAAERERFTALVEEARRRFDPGDLLVSNSAKDPHRLGETTVLVRDRDGLPRADAGRQPFHPPPDAYRTLPRLRPSRARGGGSRVPTDRVGLAAFRHYGFDLSPASSTHLPSEMLQSVAPSAPVLLPDGEARRHREQVKAGLQDVDLAGAIGVEQRELEPGRRLPTRILSAKGEGPRAFEDRSAPSSRSRPPDPTPCRARAGDRLAAPRRPRRGRPASAPADRAR